MQSDTGASPENSLRVPLLPLTLPSPPQSWGRGEGVRAARVISRSSASRFHRGVVHFRSRRHGSAPPRNGLHPPELEGPDMPRATIAATAGLALLIIVPGVAGRSFGQVLTAANEPKIVEISDSFTSGTAKIQVRRFERPGTDRRPAVVLLHGCDGWEQLAAYRFVATSLVESGYVVVLIRYFDRTGTPDQVDAARKADFLRWLDGKARHEKENTARQHFEAWIGTVGDAVAYTRQLPNVDADRVGLVGISLGAFVAVAAAAAAEPDFKIRAVVDLFGGLPQEMQKSVQALPPTLILHGEDDSVVSVKEAYALYGLLLKKNVVVQAHIYPGVGHCLIPPGKSSPDPAALMNAKS